MNDVILYKGKNNIYKKQFSITKLERKPRVAKMIIAKQMTTSMNEELEKLSDLMMKSVMKGLIENGN